MDVTDLDTTSMDYNLRPPNFLSPKSMELLFLEITDDDIVEPEESFIITLIDMDFGTIYDELVVTIMDNDIGR